MKRKRLDHTRLIHHFIKLAIFSFFASFFPCVYFILFLGISEKKHSRMQQHDMVVARWPLSDRHLVPFLGTRTQKLFQRCVSLINLLTSGKGSTSVGWSPRAKAGKDAECRIYGGWVKCKSRVNRLSTKVREILRKYINIIMASLVVSNAVLRLSALHYVSKIFTISSLGVVEKLSKIGILGLLSFAEKPQILNVDLQVTFQHVTNCGWVFSFSDLRCSWRKKEKNSSGKI